MAQNKYSDVAIVGTNTLYDSESILQSIKTAILTKKGERIFQPDVGSDLDKFLFGYVNEDSALDIKTEIKRVIAMDSRVTLTDIQIVADEANNLYKVSISVSIDGTVSSDSFTLQPKGL